MQQSSVTPDRLSFNAALSACVRCSQPQAAGTLRRSMGLAGIKPDIVTYNTLAGLQVAGDAQQRVLAEMNSLRLQPDVRTYNPMISACAESKDWEGALKLLHQMDRAAIPPDVITFNRLLSVCEASGQWELALELLSTMGARGLQPDLTSFNSAISACAAGRAWESAVQLLQSMKQYGPAPDVISYNAAIAACAKAAKWDWALGLLGEIDRQGLLPDDISFNSAMNACSKAGQWEWALRLLQALEQRSLPLTVVSYATAMDACGVSGQWPTALNLLQDMKQRAVQPCSVTHHILVLLLIRNGQTEIAETLFAEAVQDGVLRDWKRRPDMIDLHEQPVEVAKLAVLIFLQEALARRMSTELTIITGRGRHSASGIPLIRPAVMSLLQDELDLQVGLDAGNPGILYVPASEVVRLQSSQVVEGVERAVLQECIAA